MSAATIFQSETLRVDDYRCRAGPQDTPYPEVHDAFVLAYVRQGSFGYRLSGRHFELVAGSLLVGRRGDEFLCTHDHHSGGDTCLSIHFSRDAADELGAGATAWRAGSLPPHPEIMVLGALAEACASGRADVSLEEVAMAIASRFADLAEARDRRASRLLPRERRRAVQAALWIEANSADDVDLKSAADLVGSSRFHFLRVFTRVLGVTPHQYLMRSRIRRAARLLCEEGAAVTDVALQVGFGDLSNFVRTFRRASGVTPGNFRRLAGGAS